MEDNAPTPCELVAAEVMRGLANDRSELLRARHSLLANPVWQYYREHWEKLTAEIEETDKRIDAILAKYSANDKAHLLVGEEKL